MKTERYKPHKHNDYLHLWLKERDKLNWLDNLPKVGYLVCDEDGIFIAAGFIRKVEGNLGLLDSYITNPRSASGYRHVGLDLLTRKLIAQARSMKLKGLLAPTAYANISDRAISHGFEISDMWLLTLDLS